MPAGMPGILKVPRRELASQVRRWNFSTKPWPNHWPVLYQGIT